MLQWLLTLLILFVLLPFILFGGILGCIFSIAIIQPAGGWIAYSNMIATRLCR